MRPIKDIADAIQRQDAKWLTTLPGIGPATAEQVVATLRRKVTKFALMPAAGGAEQTTSVPANVDGKILEEAYQALMSLGHSPQDARLRLDKVLAGGAKFHSAEEIVVAIYKGN